MQENKIIYIRLEDETHRRLKVFCAEKGISIQQMISSMIVDFFKAKDKKKGKT